MSEKCEGAKPRTAIITRPEEDAGFLQQELINAGLTVHLAPMIAIQFEEAIALEDKPYQAVLFTSANGVRALQTATMPHRLVGAKAICVGPASAAVARSAGFNEIIRASETNVSGMIATIKNELSAANGPLLYPSGRQVSGDLETVLTAHGFEVDRRIVYEARAMQTLPDSVATILAKNVPAMVLLYSVRTAKIWCNGVEREGFSAAAANLVYYCLSQAVGDVIRDHFGSGAATLVCQRPDDAAMIELITRDH